MDDLEALNENRFYRLIPNWQQRCTNLVDDIYDLEEHSDTGFLRSKKPCNGLLWMNIKNSSINLKCRHVECGAEYEVFRNCNFCGKKHYFDDVTCDNCEPVVINITTWRVSIDEGTKAIKKVNRAFKQGLIDEKEWKNVIGLQKDEIERCQKNLEKVEKDLNLSIK